MLYRRIIGVGTINEPRGKPDPQFALPSTVNWMRSLSILIAEKGLNFEAARQFYDQQGRRSMDKLVENTVLEQLFLSLHHLSALQRMKKEELSSDYARIGILAWYYGVSNAAKAMIAAQDSSFQEDHAGTSKVWDTSIAARKLAMDPFNWRVSSLVESVYKHEVQIYRAGSDGKLQSKPSTAVDALGVAAGYLSGSAKWYAWKATEDVRNSHNFKALGRDDFRTKAARELRDERLSKRTVGFVHQAARYRGKANYREALFLAYGSGTETVLQGFIADQAAVLNSFLAMAGAFASRKLGKKLWSEFVADVDANRAFSTSAASVWT